MDGFIMPNLNKVLIDDDGKYEIDRDYKYFFSKKNAIKVKKDGKKIKKELFLTMTGFRKVIEISRQNFNEETKTMVHKWLNQFDNTRVNNYIINIGPKSLILIGYTYCVTSDLLDSVKIGYWTGSIDGLKKRYATYYGKELVLYYVKTLNAKKLEDNVTNILLI